MEDTLISFETAKLAKKKGFNINTKKYYELDTIGNYQLLEIPIIPHDHQDELYLAPTQSLLQKWLREQHNIFISVQVSNHAWADKFSFARSVRHIKSKNSDKFYSYMVREVYTYEEALEKALQEGLKLIKTK